MHIGQGVPAKLQAQRRHQQQGMDTRVRHRLQIITVNNQLTLRIAGVAVIRAFLAVAAQAIQIRCRAGEDQRRLPAR
ncbi:hypothetical protein D9M71_749170 [compost metagenome]